MGRREDIEAELALQDQAIERHERKIAKAIKDAMLQVATDLRATLNPDLPFDHFRRIEEAMHGLYRDITRSMAASMVGRFKSGFEYLETKDDNDGFYERVLQDYLNQYGGMRIAQISETTRRQIVAMIDKGLRDGLSVDDIAGEIRLRAEEMSKLRAHTIARTETHSASMYASLQSAKQSTVELLKEWVSVEDSRTRDFGEGDGVVDFYDHRSMNGVRVPMDDPFEVPNKLGGSERLMFPGDPAGSAANIINCRCAQVYVDPEEDEDEDDVDVIASPVAVPVSGYPEQASLLGAMSAKTNLGKQMAGSFTGARLPLLRAAAKARDLGSPITIDPQDGAYHFRNRISMGTHTPGTRAYENVFRHEYGHALDDTIAIEMGLPRKKFASWAAIDDLLEETNDLRLRKTSLHAGDKHTKAEIARVAKNHAKRAALRTKLTDEVLDEAGPMSAPTADDVFRKYIPELDPSDIMDLYNDREMDPRSAINIVVSWQSRDVSDAIMNLPIIHNGGNISHASAFAGLQDVFEAGTGGNVRMYFGHGKKYYTERNPINEYYGMTTKLGAFKVNGHSTAQAFANWTDAYGNPNPAAYELYKRLWPKTSATFEKLVEDFAAL